MRIETTNQPAKDQRIATRVTEAHKSLFERAAMLKGLSLTDFMVSSAYDAAVKTLEDSQVLLTLSPDASLFFFESVLHPREPSELPELQEAFRHYRQSMES